MPKKIEHITPDKLFKRFVPENAIQLCVNLYREHKFQFRVTPPRATKLGDYRFDPSDDSHTITINNDLKPYSFLITYIHEVAHLTTVKKYGRKVAHHGKEWKNEYSHLLKQTLLSGAFPPNLAKEVMRFSMSPKASTSASARLVALLNEYENDTRLLLTKIKINQKFIFRGEEYIKLEKKRTRSLCVRLADKKKFLISEIAEVEL